MKTFTYSTPEEFIHIMNLMREDIEQSSGSGSGYNQVEKAHLTQKIAGPHVKLHRHTRNHTGEIFLPSTRNTKVVEGSSIVRHGYFLERLESDIWWFESWTLDEGRHVLNFSTLIDDDGIQRAPGKINYFGLGMSVLDEQSYVTEQLEAQLEESQKIENYWDLKEQ